MAYAAIPEGAPHPGCNFCRVDARRYGCDGLQLRDTNAYCCLAYEQGTGWGARHIRAVDVFFGRMAGWLGCRPFRSRESPTAYYSLVCFFHLSQWVFKFVSAIAGYSRFAGVGLWRRVGCRL